MSLKQEIETWVEALAKYDSNEFEASLQVFDRISDTSKILFNCGVIRATLGEHVQAIECYQRAVALDRYLAIAYFQQGVSNFLLGDYDEACANFNDTLLYLRGNTYIDYEQLGLKFKLYSCEALFNRGLCYIYRGQKKGGMEDLSFAAKEKVTPDHDVIDEAIREEAEGYTVFSIPVGVVYRPNSSKVKNLKSKDYLGKARLIAAADKTNMFTGFAGAEKQMQITPDTSRDDRPAQNISYAASNLVRQDLISRSQRQQSEPPMNRNAFPPTPPPEGELSRTSSGLNNRATSIRDGTGAGRRLPPIRTNTGRQATIDEDSPSKRAMNSAPPTQNRVGTLRTSSENRSPAQRYSPARSDRGRQYQDAPRRQQSGDDADDRYPDDLYDLYSATASANPYAPKSAHSTRQVPRRQNTISSEMDHDSGGSSMDDFEMLNDASGMHPSMSRGTSRSRRPADLRTIRVKMHHNDESRYLMVNTGIVWEDFLDRAREKLGLRGRFKVRMKDEGDLITVGDADDWDMAIQTSKRQARKDGDDMARLQVKSCPVYCRNDLLTISGVDTGILTTY